MEVLSTILALRERVAAARSGGPVGLVPTMGAFHAGHVSLMVKARRECKLVVVSLFVNPTQFGPQEDLARYPRDWEGDCWQAAQAGVDVIFAPPVAEVYPPGFCTSVEVAGLTDRLCGASRPGHFRGVATVVTKLLLMARPDRAYFGQKDYQQLQVVRRLARDLNLPVQIVGCPIVRDSDGLALSSRNRYLTVEERGRALVLPRACRAARERFLAGARDPKELLDAVREVLASEPKVRLDYVELVDGEDLTPISRVTRPAVLAIAAYVGTTRLIDNIVLYPDGEPV